MKHVGYAMYWAAVTSIVWGGLHLLFGWYTLNEIVVAIVVAVSVALCASRTIRSGAQS